MNNFVFVHVLQSDDDIADKKFGLSLVENPLISKMVPQISSIKVIHDEVKMLSILEGVLDIDQEGMVESG